MPRSLLPILVLPLALSACKKTEGLTLREAIAEAQQEMPDAVAPYEEVTGETIEAAQPTRTAGAKRQGPDDGSSADVEETPAVPETDSSPSGEGTPEPSTAETSDGQSPPSAPANGQSTERGPPKGLTILSDDTWKIPQSLADRWEANPYRLGRAVQADEGWRITRVKQGSPGWWLGVRRGDVILTVNGMKLNNKAQLLAAYLKLKNKTTFEVAIQRAGAIRTHTYIIEG